MSNKLKNSTDKIIPKFLSFLGLSLLLLITPVFVSAIQVKPENYGAVVNDSIDDSEAVQAAISAVLAEGGGTVLFPTGKIDIKSMINLVPQGYAGAEIKLQGTRGSVVEVSVGVRNTAFYAGNLNILTFEDLIIIGKNVPATAPDFYDAKYVVYSTYVNQTNIIRCQFYGLAVPEKAAVLYLGNTDTRISDSQFDGNLASYPDGAVILAENTRGLTVSRTTFMDYANFHGTYTSKSPLLTGAWIAVKGGLALNGNGQRRILVEDSRFDEGAATAISVENVSWVTINSINVNVNNSDGARGVYLRNIDYAKIEQSWFGYASNARPALDFENVLGADVTSLKFSDGVYFFKQFGSVKMNINFCPQCVQRPSLKKNNKLL